MDPLELTRKIVTVSEIVEVMVSELTAKIPKKSLTLVRKARFD